MITPEAMAEALRLAQNVSTMSPEWLDRREARLLASAVAALIARTEAAERERADLARKLAEAHEALRPFADMRVPHQVPDHWLWQDNGGTAPNVGDFRRAFAVLSAQESAGK